MNNRRKGLQISFTDEVPHSQTAEPQTTHESASHSTSRHIPTPKVVQEVFAAKCSTSTAKILSHYYNITGEYTKPVETQFARTPSTLNLSELSPDVVRDVLNHLTHGTSLLNPSSDLDAIDAGIEITAGMSPGK